MLEQPLNEEWSVIDPTQEDENFMMTSKPGYNPFKFPGNLEEAKLHYECQRQGTEPALNSKGEIVMCPCCL